MIPGLDTYKERFGIRSDNAIKPGLQSMEEALRRLGNPEKEIRFIHLAGTNGKGSTLTFVQALARTHGLKVGSFMSPCIVDVHDQLQLNGQPITPLQMESLFHEMRGAELDGLCTDFELLTCAAFLFFARQKVDVAIVEAGMGGLLDSTNVLLPSVSIIPSIALEHTNFLGETLQEITEHKAGIIKSAPVVVGIVPEEAKQVIERVAQEKDIEAYFLGEQFDVTDNTFTFRDVQFTNLKRSMIGVHQAQNMGLAIQAFLLFMQTRNILIDEQLVRQAIVEAKLPFRMEEVQPNVFLDGAHNPASAEKLVQTVEHYFPGKSIRFVVGMLRDKDVRTVLRQFERVSNHFSFIDFQNERAMRASDMLTISEATDKRIIYQVTETVEQKQESEIIIITGSLYLLSEIRATLLK